LHPERYPKWFDYSGDIPPFDPRGLPSNADTVFRGIYRLEGDTLTICSIYNGREKDRPTRFESTGGAGRRQGVKRQGHGPSSRKAYTPGAALLVPVKFKAAEEEFGGQGK